jgi:hypothetical protein
MLLAPADGLARLPDYPAKRITSCRGLADSEFRPRCLSEAAIRRKRLTRGRHRMRT